MTENFFTVVGAVGYAIEGFGVFILTIGFVVSTFRFFTSGESTGQDRIENYRRELGRSMLLGLEFLVAGDIIRTVVVEHTTQSILALGLIVMIRTVLVFTIHLEVHGVWPWQSSRQNSEAG